MKIKPQLVIKDTQKYGRGVYAGENIRRGQIIYILSGKRMTINDFVEKVNSDRENIDDPFQIGKRTYIDLDEFSRTFNHSCNPTAGIRNTSELFALTDIEKGQEITYDYSLTVAPTVWKMKCKCGSKNCRKVLGDVLSIPKKQLEKYKKEGALQRYMKLLLKGVKNGKYEIPKYELSMIKRLKKTSEEF